MWTQIQSQREDDVKTHRERETCDWSDASSSQGTAKNPRLCLVSPCIYAKMQGEREKLKKEFCFKTAV